MEDCRSERNLSPYFGGDLLAIRESVFPRLAKRRGQPIRPDGSFSNDPMNRPVGVPSKALESKRRLSEFVSIKSSTL